MLTSSVAWVSKKIKEVQFQKHIFLVHFILIVEGISSSQYTDCYEYCFSIPKAVHTISKQLRYLLEPLSLISRTSQLFSCAMSFSAGFFILYMTLGYTLTRAVKNWYN